jgi:hydrogenase maturation protein HypF
VHDLHPDYFTTRRAAELQLPTIAVQHHFAHVAAGMLEHGLLNQTVLGVAWDGTGYGTDGTVWGGEFLVVEQARRFARVAHLRPFALAGGEAAILEPVRSAIAVLHDSIGSETLLRAGIAGTDTARVEQILKILQSPRLSVQTTSAGRLFDAAAALVLPIGTVDFDGQAAMLLEAIADHSAAGSYPLPLTSDSPMKSDNPLQLDWRPLFAAMWEDHRCGESPGVMAMRFHRALAEGIAAVVRRHPDLPIVLSGGVFQNRLLTELVVELLNGSPLLKLPGRIPPNDGGLAAGQLAVASQLEKAGMTEVPGSTERGRRSLRRRNRLP